MDSGSKNARKRKIELMLEEGFDLDKAIELLDKNGTCSVHLVVLLPFRCFFRQTAKTGFCEKRYFEGKSDPGGI